MITNRIQRYQHHLLAVIAVAYCIAELIALAVSMHVIPFFPTLIHVLIPVSIGLGVFIEIRLAGLAGKAFIATLPLAYMLPIYAGFAGRSVAWLSLLSVVLFIVLLICFTYRFALLLNSLIVGDMYPRR